MNPVNPLEKALRDLPLEKIPDDVYARLQSKAAWNCPPVAQPRPFVIPILILLGFFVALLAAYEFVGKTTIDGQNHPEETVPATMSHVIARTQPTTSSNKTNERDDPSGFPSRALEMEPAFEVRFGDSPTMLQAEGMELDS